MASTRPGAPPAPATRRAAAAAAGEEGGGEGGSRRSREASSAIGATLQRLRPRRRAAAPPVTARAGIRTRVPAPAAGAPRRARPAAPARDARIVPAGRAARQQRAPAHRGRRPPPPVPGAYRRPTAGWHPRAPRRQAWSGAGGGEGRRGRVCAVRTAGRDEVCTRAPPLARSPPLSLSLGADPTPQPDHPQRTSAPAKVSPAPKPARATVSPALMRPPRTASSSASGMDAALVLP